MSAFGMQVPTGTLFDMQFNLTIDGGKATLVTIESGTETTTELEGDLDTNALVLKSTEEKTEEEKQKKKKKRTGKNYAEFTGVIAYYSEGGKSIKLTSGDQTKPLKLTHIYKSKKTATNALKREQAKIDKYKKSK